MRILAVDTSTPSGSLAVLEDARVVAVVANRSDETYSSRLFRELQGLLQEQSLEIGNFDLFAVVSGPGSFTGLRVGLTAVKGWAEVYGKAVAAVSGLEAVAAQATGPEAWIAAVMDARRGQVYAGSYKRTGAGLRRQGEEMVLTAAEFLTGLAQSIGDARPVFAVTDAAMLETVLQASPYAGCRVEVVSAALAPVVGQLGYERAQRGEVVDALALDAHYIRRSDAELLWKG
jgi:tRNA threonylcarbamoyladenosine biosynthesis protein TsaB